MYVFQGTVKRSHRPRASFQFVNTKTTIGVDSPNNLLVIGMTNRKDMIDQALLRPGRLEVQTHTHTNSERFVCYPKVLMYVCVACVLCVCVCVFVCVCVHVCTCVSVYGRKDMIAQALLRSGRLEVQKYNNSVTKVWQKCNTSVIACVFVGDWHIQLQGYDWPSLSALGVLLPLC
jgi:hypothetical protein